MEGGEKIFAAPCMSVSVLSEVKVAIEAGRKIKTAGLFKQNDERMGINHKWCISNKGL